MPRPFFAFDLDGTITAREILPVLAEELGLGPEFALLTRLTMRGGMDFAASLRLRFAALRQIPLAAVHGIMEKIPLDPDIERFIQLHAKRCAVVTGNVDVWVRPLAERLGCAFITSESAEENGALRLVSVLDKGKAVRALAREGKKVIAVGDGANDIPMFKEAHAGIAYGGVNAPPPELIAKASRTVYSGKELAALLSSFLAT